MAGSTLRRISIRPWPAPIRSPSSRTRTAWGTGTHVAGIAAGSGSGGAAGFLGIAPEADLIVVSYASEGVTLGGSGRALAAVAYVVDRAAGRSVSINISQGMNGGGHCGETSLETGIDDLLRRPGVVVVKSAGNETGWQIHAGGQMVSGETAILEIRLEANLHEEDVLEIWFSGNDAISVAVQAPGGAVSRLHRARWRGDGAGRPPGTG